MFSTVGRILSSGCFCKRKCIIIFVKTCSSFQSPRKMLSNATSFDSSGRSDVEGRLESSTLGKVNRGTAPRDPRNHLSPRKTALSSTLTFVFPDALSRDPVGGRTPHSSPIQNPESRRFRISEAVHCARPSRVALSSPFLPPFSLSALCSSVRRPSSSLALRSPPLATVDLSFHTRSPLVQR